MKVVLFFLALVTVTLAHDEYSGACPTFKPMEEFSWSRFRDGRWYATEKFDVTGSKCITYDFGVDEDGVRYVEQNSILTGLARFSVDNKFKYRGKIIAPSTSEPANMIVKFPLSLLGSASFVVLDSDYDNYALVCTCQSKRIVFDIFTFHRRSCTILQRSPERDATISRQLHDLLNEQIPTEAGDEKADHDFDNINHVQCDYEDNGKGLQIDVDKILGSTKSEISEAVATTVDELHEVFFKRDEDKEREEVTFNLPMKDNNPRV